MKAICHSIYVNIFIEIISIGAAPYDNRVQWLEETKKVGSVIRMVLRPIGDLFELYPIIETEVSGLEEKHLYILFYSLPKNYCVIMFGKI